MPINRFCRCFADDRLTSKCGHYIGLHIPPAVLEYGTPGFNAGKKDPEWELPSRKIFIL